MFAVVSSSIRPSGIFIIASAAAMTALMPSSGATPAWAATPCIVASKVLKNGAATAIEPNGPCESIVITVLDCTLL